MTTWAFAECDNVCIVRVVMSLVASIVFPWVGLYKTFFISTRDHQAHPLRRSASLSSYLSSLVGDGYNLLDDEYLEHSYYGEDQPRVTNIERLVYRRVIWMVCSLGWGLSALYPDPRHPANIAGIFLELGSVWMVFYVDSMMCYYLMEPFMLAKSVSFAKKIKRLTKTMSGPVMGVIILVLQGLAQGFDSQGFNGLMFFALGLYELLWFTFFWALIIRLKRTSQLLIQEAPQGLVGELLRKLVDRAKKEMRTFVVLISGPVLMCSIFALLMGIDYIKEGFSAKLHFPCAAMHLSFQSVNFCFVMGGLIGTYCLGRRRKIEVDVDSIMPQ